MPYTAADFDTIFYEAAEMPDAGARTEFLRRACGTDDDLRRKLEELLAAHFEAGDFLSDDSPSHDAAPLPTFIGPYKLLEQIGEGGFGVVYMAEQQKPMHRRVALKLLKPGLDTLQVVARFDAERQALALMDHPNIARVFDGGTTGEPATQARETRSAGSQGRPYFVMELVRGIPITEFADENRMPLRERLELFLCVCSAVQHAHQKGIIHRDLKPSNVLVTQHDATPVPKVIDFGIAKSTGPRLTDKTLFTDVAQCVGTPLYMSPEQAQMNGLDVDTRSDVYSLGVLLYELLTGTTPFDRERLREAGYDEFRRIIREEEPAPPSARLSTLGAAAVTTSANRRSDVQHLRRRLRGELDWVVMKALEKDRNRRYESASALAADVLRYLRDEPVEACPPSAWYRLGKTARRHKTALIAGSLVASSLLIGAGIAVWQAMIATQAAAEEKRAKELAQTREAETRAVLVSALASSYFEAGRHPEGISLFEESLALLQTSLPPDHPHTLIAMYTLARRYEIANRHADALPLYERVLSGQRAKLGSDCFESLLTMFHFANCLIAVNRAAEAVPLLDEFIPCANRTGWGYHSIAQALSQRQHYFESIRDVAGLRTTADMWDALGRTDAACLCDAGRSRAITAQLLHLAGDYQQAEIEANRALDLLTRGVRGGYRNLYFFEVRLNLDVLRDRPDFKAIVAELRASQASDKE